MQFWYKMDLKAKLFRIVTPALCVCVQIQIYIYIYCIVRKGLGKQLGTVWRHKGHFIQLLDFAYIRGMCQEKTALHFDLR